MPIVFTNGQVRRDVERPTLITWMQDQEPDIASAVLAESQGVPLPTVPRHEETWLQKPYDAWKGLFEEIRLQPVSSDTTMLILTGPPTNAENLDGYFVRVAAATERAAGWRVPDDGLTEWAAKLADVEPPLDLHNKALVRWIAALDRVANP